MKVVCNLENVVLGGLIGLCVGDALGVPVEFLSRKKLIEKPVTDILGYGTHNQPPGTWSDDSSLTFCLMESLCQGYSIEDIAQKFVRWYEEGYWTPYGEIFDIGNATLQAISRVQRGCKPEEAGGKTVYDNGNGSLMRILPLAYYLLRVDDIKVRLKIVHDVSSITHGHIRSKMACFLYIEFVQNLLKDVKSYDAYINAIKVFESVYCCGPYLSELKHFQNLISGEIQNFKEDELLSTGYVIHTLESSIWCFLNSNDYKSAVLKAVNLGDDADTTAAVTGGIAGIYYGLSAIPPKWIDTLARKEDIFSLCKRFSKTVDAYPLRLSNMQF